MKAEMVGTLQATERILVFHEEYPVNDPGSEPVVGVLREDSKRAGVYVVQQAESHTRWRTATRDRRRVRKHLSAGCSSSSPSSSRWGGGQLPNVGDLRVPYSKAPDPTFLFRAEGLIEAVKANLPVLAQFGANQGLVDEATALLNQFKVKAAAAREAFQARVEATSALDTLRNGINKAIERLDRLNRHRFADQAMVLARWETAKNIVTRSPRTKPEPDAPPSGLSGDVSAAA